MLRKLTELNVGLIEDDPVRSPFLFGDARRRFQEPFLVYGWIEDEDIQAVVCLAFAEFLPETEADLITIANDTIAGDIIVPYSLWSYKQGAGSKLIQGLLELASKTHEPRVITMSPKTEMAEKFHTKNGAVILSVNEESVNYAYPL